MVNFVDFCIKKAIKGETKLNQKAYEFDGMSSFKIRNFLNSLLEFPHSRYLEIGVWKGSTFYSALYMNNVEYAVAIDNWSQYHGTLEAFKENIKDLEVPYEILSRDSFSVDKSFFKKTFNIYFYDGGHKSLEQEKALTYYLDVLEDTFIFICDDWNDYEVKEGTRSGIRKCNLKIEKEWELPAKYNGDKENWWNGLYVAVLSKPKGKREYQDLDILMLTTKSIPDYLQDALYMGLCELGCNVVDKPRRKSLHGDWYSEEYRTEQLLFQYPELDLRKSPDVLIVTGMYQNFNCCKTMKGWTDFIQEVLIETEPRKFVMLDAEDSRSSSYPIIDRNYDIVFKRELFSIPYPNWRPIHFAAIPESFQYVPYNQRKYDVSFIATMSHPYRIEVKDFLLKKCEELGLTYYIYVEKKPLDRSRMLEILSQSKTSVSVRGAGQDCYRYWELPAKGLVMIADDSNLIIENDFDNSQIFKFRDIDELERILIQIKTFPEILEEMAVRSLLHTVSYHTPKHRAESFLKEIFAEELWS